jgi:hypothetical protein
MKDYLKDFLDTRPEKTVESPQVPHPQKPQKASSAGAFEAFEGTPPMGTGNFSAPDSRPFEGFEGTPPTGTGNFVSPSLGPKNFQEPTDTPPSKPSKAPSRPAATAPVPLSPHYPCGGTRRWRSIYGVLICGRCHPPAEAALVAGWEGKDTDRTIDTQEGEVQ